MRQGKCATLQYLGIARTPPLPAKKAFQRGRDARPSVEGQQEGQDRFSAGELQHVAPRFSPHHGDQRGSYQNNSGAGD